ncbi:hypothetical protein Trydic_g12757 [Trypoxylus dichotomus]
MAQEGFLKIIFNESSDETERQRILPFGNSELYQARIRHAVRLTKGEDVKDVYDIALDTENVSYRFQPGDTIGILPNNDINEVNEIFERLNCFDLLDKKCCIILLDAKKARLVSHLPINTTLKEVFLQNVDIRTPPKKTFLKILMKHTENEEEKSILEKLASPSNSQDYISFISNDGRRLVNLLRAFPSCKIPIKNLLENLPPLQPRAYSISSSPLLKGLCSGWLEQLITPVLEEKPETNEDLLVKFYFRKPNSFRLHPEISSPIIMIGPGTGVAPFIGFLEHLYLEKRTLDSWLFYGCRYKNKDFLYKDKLEEYLKENYLTKLSVAFSRDQDIKVYVQDLIKNETREIYEKIVSESATLFVCGDLKDMMKDVKNSIHYCLVNNGMDAHEADLFILNMIKTKKYIEDAWI